MLRSRGHLAQLRERAAEHRINFAEYRKLTGRDQADADLTSLRAEYELVMTLLAFTFKRWLDARRAPGESCGTIAK